MRIAVWNVCILCRAGTVKEMVKYMCKYKIDTCVLKENRWPGKGTVIKKEIYDFIHWT